MSDDTPGRDDDFARFHENWHKYPQDQLAQYAGQYVAWSLDGTRILASGATEEEMEQRLRAAGIDPSRVVGDYIHPPGTVLL